jgi:P4 family phage/plasmid primase-like protien
MILEGEGANGKSVVCEVLTALLGKENVSNVPLEMFGERFQLTQTLGKLANIASEVDQIKGVAEGHLKAFTAGDKMYFDRKGIPGIHAYPTARLLFSTNQRPRFADRSGGMWRRLIDLPFRVTIPEERQDKNLTSKLIKELPGIFLWAVEGLRRLRLNGRFTEPVICKAALDEYLAESNPTREYLREHYEYDPNASTKTQEAYQHYVGWAKDRGHPPLNERQFGQDVVRAFPHIEKKKRGSAGARFSLYVGLGQLPSDEPEVTRAPLGPGVTMLTMK